MKKNPYESIINFKVEQKEYARLCNGKKSKFRAYSDWEAHIEDLLSNISTTKDLYNFKHYCINKARVQEKAPEVYLTCIVLMITVYIEKLMSISIPTLPIMVAFLILLNYVIPQNSRITKECYFYKDIIGIVEKVEVQRINDKKP